MPCHSKKIVHILFCEFRTKLNKAVNIFCRLPEWFRNVQMIPGFSTRLGWERGWKSYMDNSKDWRSENEHAIELNCKIVKKVATPPLFSGLSPISSKKISHPPSDSIFGSPTPSPLLIRKGGSNYGKVWRSKHNIRNV